MTPFIAGDVQAEVIENCPTASLVFVAHPALRQSVRQFRQGSSDPFGNRIRKVLYRNRIARKG